MMMMDSEKLKIGVAIIDAHETDMNRTSRSSREISDSSSTVLPLEEIDENSSNSPESPHPIGFTMSREQTLSLRSQLIPSACSLHFERSPMKVTWAQGQYLYDDTGSEFLDCVNCVAHVGHCHPVVVNAGKVAMKNIGFVPVEINRLARDYVQKLKSTFPPQYDSYLFVSSCSEANDLAIQLARLYTGCSDVVVVERGYHGSVTLTNAISSKSYYQQNYQNHMPEWIHVLACPDLYRGKFRENNLEGVEKYIEDAKNTLENIKNDGRQIAAFISEPILSKAGIIIPPIKWIKTIYEKIKSYGGLTIADEAQTGLGRCGTSWWAFQSFDLMPDIVTIGKPLGNGHPMALVVTKSSIASKLGTDLSRYSCDTVAASIGIAVINTVRKDAMQINAKKVGNFLKEGLKAIADNHPNLGEVRGVGLMIGVEVVYNKMSRKPAKDIAERICYMMKERNIVIGNEGIYKNVIIITPPMCFTLQNSHNLLVNLQKVLAEIENESDMTDSPPPTYENNLTSPSYTIQNSLNASRGYYNNRDYSELIGEDIAFGEQNNEENRMNLMHTRSELDELD